VVSNLRFIDLCDRGTLRPVRLCLTTPLKIRLAPKTLSDIVVRI